MKHAERPIAFIRWRSDVPSGGNRYDDELTEALRRLGIAIDERMIEGTWPLPSPEDRARLRALLFPGTGGEQEARHWLLDNIVGSAVPDLIREATETGHRVTMLMHYFASDEAGLEPELRDQLAESEARAVAAATGVVATSAWTAQEVARRYGRDDAVVAVPGVAEAEIAPGSVRNGRPPVLLWLARVTRTKDPLTLVDALALLREHSWTAQIVGPGHLDEALDDELQSRIDAAGLVDRVGVLGPRRGEELERVWARTDLLVHTARSEAYGMVVTEATSRGIPSVVPVGTGAEEAQQGVGGAFAAGDAVGLANVLRTWLVDGDVREKWRRAATTRRAELSTWDDAARTVATVLER